MIELTPQVGAAVALLILITFILWHLYRRQLERRGKPFDFDKITLAHIRRQLGTSLGNHPKALIRVLDRADLSDVENKERVEASIKLRKLTIGGSIRAKTICSELPRLLDILKRLDAKLRWAARDSNYTWLQADSYQYSRYDAVTILELLRKLNDPQSKNVLFSLLNHPDPMLTCYSIMALLERRESVSSEAFERVAAWAETRNILYDYLKERNMLDLFPSKYCNQKDLAESKMVNWLAFPTELNAVPDDIELVSIVATESGKEPMDYYVFRFRTNPPHWAAEDGWMFGVSGPFSHSRLTTEAKHTFSQFDSWNELTPEQIVDEVRTA